LLTPLSDYREYAVIASTTIKVVCLRKVTNYAKNILAWKKTDDALCSATKVNAIVVRLYQRSLNDN